MKRLIAGAAGIVMMATAAHAQAPFADVPRDHWAYEAVNTLSQRGLIIGYPDGTFGGKRAMTRYEFAVVIARMIPQLEEYIRTTVANATPAAPTGDWASKADLNNYVTRSDFDALSRLVNEFRPELQMLRVDVDNLRRDLNDLRGRIATLEEEVGRVRISGEGTAIARMSSTNRGTLANGIVPTDLNGRPLNPTTNLLEASQMLYDFDLGISAKVSKGINANAIFNVGNYLGGFASAPFAAGLMPPFDRNIFPYGGASRSSSNAEFSAYKAYIEAPIAFRPLGMVSVEAGKTGVQFTPYTLKLVDYDDYTNITKTDNGDVIFTGLKGKFRVGGVGVTAYGGTHGSALLQGSLTADPFLGLSYPSASGFPVIMGSGSYSPSGPFSYDQSGFRIPTVPELLYGDLPYLAVPVTQSTGVHATLGTPFGGTLGLTYINAGINNTYIPNGTPGFAGAAAGFQDVGSGSVYGADLALNLSRGIGITAEYANSNLFARGKQNAFSNKDSVFNRKLKEAYDARLTFGLRNIALSAGWKKVDPLFAAPGAWGAIGRWKNPTNIEGMVGTIGIPLTKGLSFAGSAESYRSIVAGLAVDGAGLAADPLREDRSTRIGRWTAGFKFDLTSANRVDLGVESVLTRPNAAVNPYGPNRARAQETFYNFGIGHNLSDNANLKLLYQIIDYKDNGANFLNGGQDARGSVAVGQFTVKF